MTKNALVTGAGRGIGKTIAIELAKHGYDVCVSYCGSEEQALDTKAQIEALGRKCIAVKADLSKLEEIPKLFEVYEAAFGTIDLLVNNAGITKFKPFLEVDPEMFELLTAVDYRATFFCAQAAAKLMIKHGTKGSIVNICSNHRSMNFPIASVYGSAKTAVFKLTQHIALELAPYGIRVNSISPGYIKVTDPNVVSEREKMMVSRIPVGRIGQPVEIANMVRYLASDEAQFITGSDMLVDGGALLPALMDNTYIK